MSFAIPSWLDYFIFYQQGQLLWQGQYASLYPLPMVGWFALFALLPPWVGGVIWFLLSLAVLVALTRRKALLWLLYPPLVNVLLAGQPDVFFLGLYSIGSPVALALMTLKPQLFIFALPLLIKYTRRQWIQLAGWLALLYIPVTLVRPTWIGEWLGFITREGRPATSASFWGQPWLFLILLVLVPLALRYRLNLHGLLLSLNPGLRDYNYAMLTGRSLWLIPAGWGVMLLHHAIFGVTSVPAFLWSLLGVAAVLTDRRSKPRD